MKIIQIPPATELVRPLEDLDALDGSGTSGQNRPSFLPSN